MHAIGIDTHKDDAWRPAASTSSGRRSTSGPSPTTRPATGRCSPGSPGRRGRRSGSRARRASGAALARFLVAAGATVREVPPQLSRRERIRTRRAGKSDPGDALAIARVTLREADLPPVRLVDRTLELQLLVEAREDLVAEQTRVRNRLHADLRMLAAGLWRAGRQPHRRPPPADGRPAAPTAGRGPGRARPGDASRGCAGWPPRSAR